MTDSTIAQLIAQLSTRSARAYINQLAPRNGALRAHLTEVLERPAGQPGSFLAPPVFQSKFGYKQLGETLGELAKRGYLHPQLVTNMDAPPKEFKGQAFRRAWRPFTHQYKSWQILKDDKPRSLVVSSGTGSGKTECFLVPILDDLARQGPAARVGVQALLLYPLNALINSQQERLSAWTRGFDGRVRYCLYNGETEESVPNHKQNPLPERILSRKLLRDQPPGVLVTNATMLEYMLVRPKDRGILAASQGKLRYIVLDEAHTYVGSQAAELALLLRRVTHAFGVEPENIRFIATSATISSKDQAEADDRLSRFLAAIAGQQPEQVTVVHGEPMVPALPEATEPREGLSSTVLEALQAADPEERFRQLCQLSAARRIRQRIASDAATLPELSQASGLPSPQVLSLLEAGRSASRADARGEQEFFLPIRTHLFQRTQSQLWCCSNPACEGRQGSLASADWAFGPVFTSWRRLCPHCEARVYELLFCVGCGTEFLAGFEEWAASDPILKATKPRLKGDPEQEQDPGADSAEEQDPSGTIRLSDQLLLLATGELTGGAGSEERGLDPWSGELLDSGPLCSSTESRPCPRCDRPNREGQSPFRSAAVGSRFSLQVSLPALLEVVPEDEKGGGLPLRGRRALSFSDSRQGTARLAARLHSSAEYGWVRSHLYHTVWSADRGRAERVAEKRAAVEKLEHAYEGLKASGTEGLLAEALSTARKALEQAKRPAAVPLQEVIKDLAASEDLKSCWVYRRRYRPFDLSEDGLARLLVLREFAFRPRRSSSLETMGLLQLRYPTIDALDQCPKVWSALGGTPDEWRAFLKLCVDYFIRSSKALKLDREDYRWMGVEVRPSFLVEPDESLTNPKQQRWLRWRVPSTPGRLVRLLLKAFSLDPDSPAVYREINDVLDEAWLVFKRPKWCEQKSADGRRLDLAQFSQLAPVDHAWRCPVTGRLLDTTLRGHTPYQPALDAAPADSFCESVELPRPIAAWGERLSDASPISIGEIRSWLESDKVVTGARGAGVWSEFSDRIVEGRPYFQVAEHSAQLSSRELQRSEKWFKEGRLNVLSCSTTMEMGVDIGGVSAVVMGNAPPSPSNFLQRAGRAGRRNETTALTLTVCKNLPHDQAVFNNPTWPFRTPIYVSDVQLHSDRIVQRHINAACLTAFLETEVANANALSLNCAWFFTREESGSIAEKFQGWLQTVAPGDARVEHGLRALVRGSGLDGLPRSVLLDRVSETLEAAAGTWLSEQKAIREQLDEIGGEHADSPAARALSRQLARLNGEYLLAWLVSRQVLPGYGFPTGVVPFVTTTVEELKAEQRKDKERDESYGRSRGYPSRQLPLAIRDYAPGADIVLDGRVYRSAGVTLNWHIPPDGGENSVKEVQALRRISICTSCLTVGQGEATRCAACGHDGLSFQRYLEPAGFAVDLYEDARMDTRSPLYIPVEEPRISAGVEPLKSLGAEGRLRFRHSPDGELLHLNFGASGFGYAICLRCGRAEPETGRPSDHPELPSALDGHLRLRGGKNSDGTKNKCEGHEGWAIPRHLGLGGVVRTDVLELRFFQEDGQPLADKVVATTLAFVLRDALAGALGVDPREIGAQAQPWRSQDGAPPGQAVMLYDTAAGGAGFCAQAPGMLSQLLDRLRVRLSCPRDCERSCEACLLGYDTQHHIDYLDRHAALDFLTEAYLQKLSLPDSHKRFGALTRTEWENPWRGLLRELGRGGVERVRIYLHGDKDEWDMGSWSGAARLLKLTEQLPVELVMPPGLLDKLEEDQLDQLARVASFGNFTLRTDPREGTWTGAQRVWAELLGEVDVGLASSDWDALVPRAGWLETAEDELNTLGRGEGLAAAELSEPIPPISLRRPPKGQVIEVKLGSGLIQPLSKFGAAFWAVLDQAQPGLLAALKALGPAAQICYSDRYVKSPLPAALLFQVLKALVESGVADKSTQLELKTLACQPKEKFGSPYRIEHDWQSATSQQGVLQHLLILHFPKSKVELFDSIKELPHARTLELRWADGANLTVRLDQGLGFLKPSKKTKYDFTVPAGGQAAKLIGLQIAVALDGDHTPLATVRFQT
jgi:DEAD/DEAH box helicase domain-containing protein